MSKIKRMAEKNLPNIRDYGHTYWKEDGSDYSVISFPDLEALSVLIMEAKGDRSMERFACECGFCENTLQRTLRKKRKRSMAFKDIVAIARHSASETVTLDKLIAANGMIRNSDLDAVRASMTRDTSIEAIDRKCSASKFWKEISDEFAVVGKPDLKKLACLIDKARGDRSLNKFSNIAGLNDNMLRSVMNGKRKVNLPYSVLVSICKNSASDEVTMAELLIANGIVQNDGLKDRIKEIHQVSEKIKLGGECLYDISIDDFSAEAAECAERSGDDLKSEKEETLKERGNILSFKLPHEKGQLQEQEEDEKEKFLQAVSFYALDCTESERKKLKNHFADLELDPGVRMMFCGFYEETMKERQNKTILMQEYFSTGRFISNESSSKNFYAEMIREFLKGIE